MITREMIDRINYLARKQRSEGLTKEEKNEQHELRQKYLQSIRCQIIDGLKEAGIPRKSRHNGCSCGCSAGHKH